MRRLVDALMFTAMVAAVFSFSFALAQDASKVREYENFFEERKFGEVTVGRAGQGSSNSVPVTWHISARFKLTFKDCKIERRAAYRQVATALAPPHSTLSVEEFPPAGEYQRIWELQAKEIDPSRITSRINGTNDEFSGPAVRLSCLDNKTCVQDLNQPLNSLKFVDLFYQQPNFTAERAALGITSYVKACGGKSDPF